MFVSHTNGGQIVLLHVQRQIMYMRHVQSMSTACSACRASYAYATCHRQHATCNSETCKIRYATCNMEHAKCFSHLSNVRFAMSRCAIPLQHFGVKFRCEIRVGTFLWEIPLRKFAAKCLCEISLPTFSEKCLCNIPLQNFAADIRCESLLRNAPTNFICECSLRNSSAIIRCNTFCQYATCNMQHTICNTQNAFNG